MERNWIYDATVIRVIDGDTIDMDLDCGFRIHHITRVRLYGIDTPEVSTVEGREVRDWLRDQLPEGTPLTVRTIKDRTDKYGRWLGVIDVNCLPPSENPQGVSTLNDLLVMRGFARIYLF
jgi:micrococcal nuclease